MNKRFFKAVAAARRSDLHEVLQCYGDMPEVTPAKAIDQDWLHVLAQATADLTEGTRITDPEEQAYRKRKMRRQLALLVVMAEEWEKHL